MGTAHRENSQAMLQGLFPGYAEMVGEQVLGAIQRAKKTLDGSRAVRVLDIGAGSVPYSQVVRDLEEVHPVEWVFLDCDPKLPEARAEGLPPSHKWLERDFFDLCPSLKNEKSRPNLDVAGGLGGRFHVIVLSAALHELYYDAVAKHDCRDVFHQKALAWIKANLLSPCGTLIVADYAWPSSSAVKDILKIRDVQLEIAGHADPPWTFKSITYLQKESLKAGFKIIASRARGLHDELDDEELRNAYSIKNKQSNALECKLTTAELQTLRKRIGFVCVFAPSILGSSPEKKSLDLPKPNLASFVSSINAESAFLGLAEGDLRKALNSILVDQSPCQNLSSPVQTQGRQLQFDQNALLDGHSVLWHLIKEWELNARSHLSLVGIPDAGVFEVWMNLGLRLKYKHMERFVPMLPLWPGRSTGEREGGILSVQFESPSEPLVAGPVAITWHSVLKGKRSLHTWFTELHEILRENTYLGHDGKKDHREIRSLTIMAQDPLCSTSEPHKNSEDTVRSLFLASRWGSIAQQIESGHYLLILPQFSLDCNPEMHPLAEALNEKLNEIAKGVSRDAIPLPLGKPENEEFLREVFYHCNDKNDVEWCEFQKQWSRMTRPDVKSFPRNRCFTIMVLRCDGLSIETPDTLMLFTSQALPPAALEDASKHFVRLCNRLGGLETQLLVRTKGREEQLAEMLSVFGHDAKNWAGAITGILSTEWEGSQAAAKGFSESLSGRLACYSRLSSSIFDHKSESNTLEEDLENARGFWSLEDLFYGEIDAVIAQELTSLDGHKRSDTRALFEKYFTTTARRSRQELLSENGFICSVSGVSLKIPSTVTSTTPLLLSCIRLIVSELIRNIVKYQWDCHVFNGSQQERSISLNVAEHEGKDSFLFELRCTPWKATSLPEKKTYMGLLSIKLALGACRGRALTTQSVALGSGSLKLPYPDNQGVSRFTINKTGFKYE